MEDLLDNYGSIEYQFKQDPRITYIEDIFKYIAYAFTSNLQTWIRLAKVRQIDSKIVNPYCRQNVQAHCLYNIIIGAEYNQIPNAIEITDDEFNNVCNTFINAVKSSGAKFAYIIKDITNPTDAMWELCYMFFIPIRLTASTIPQHVKITSLRKWINTVFVLPFIKTYTEQYVSSNPEFSRLNDFYTTFLADYENGAKKIHNIMNLNIDRIQILLSTIACSNDFMVFTRLAMAIFLYGTIDILKYYCPNYKQCKAINSEYEGEWVIAFDQYHSKHITLIQSLQKYLNTNRG
jgi:hypothetical protein